MLFGAAGAVGMVELLTTPTADDEEDDEEVGAVEKSATIDASSESPPDERSMPVDDDNIGISWRIEAASFSKASVTMHNVLCLIAAPAAVDPQFERYAAKRTRSARDADESIGSSNSGWEKKRMDLLSASVSSWVPS